jgi:formate-nitrite transporter family protein
VYRHFPLGQHARAYEAARAAECASAQGRFWEIHRLLYEDDTWMTTGGFSDLGLAAEVPDHAAFVSCLERGGIVPSIEADLRLARDLQIPGTPGVVVNGTLLGAPPSFQELEEMLIQGRGGH